MEQRGDVICPHFNSSEAALIAMDYRGKEGKL